MRNIVCALIFAAPLLYSAAVTPPPLFVSQGSSATGMIAIYDPSGTPNVVNFELNSLPSNYYGIAVSSDGTTFMGFASFSSVPLIALGTIGPSSVERLANSLITLVVGDIITDSTHTIAFPGNSSTPTFPAYCITTRGLEVIYPEMPFIPPVPYYALGEINPRFMNAKCVSLDSSDTKVLVGTSDGFIYIFDVSQAYTPNPDSSIPYPGTGLFNTNPPYQRIAPGFSVDAIIAGSGDTAYAISFTPNITVLPFSVGTGTFGTAKIPVYLTGMVQGYNVVDFAASNNNLDYLYGVFYYTALGQAKAGLLSCTSSGDFLDIVGQSDGQSFIAAVAVDPALMNLYVPLGSGCVERYTLSNYQTNGTCLSTSPVFSLAMQPLSPNATVLYNSPGN